MSIESVTTGTLEGNGVFDVLMRAARAHLDDEYDRGRFSGGDYSALYLGVMQGVLSQAIQFALTEAQSEAQAELLAAQTDKTLIEQDLVNAQVRVTGLEGDNLLRTGNRLDQEVSLVTQQVTKLTKDTELVQQQKANLVSENSNIPLLGQKINKEIGVMTAQIEKIDQDALIGAQQVLNLKAEALNIPKQGLLVDAQKEKTRQEGLTAAEGPAQVIAQTALATKQAEQITSAISKIAKEIEVLEQKRITETAQTADMVNGEVVSGTVGKQKALYEAQTDGFKRDAEQKLAKAMIDVWSVQRTTDEGISPAGAGLEHAEIKKVLTKAKQGIGVI